MDLVALQQTSSSSHSDDTARLISSNGEPTLVLEKVQLKSVIPFSVYAQNADLCTPSPIYAFAEEYQGFHFLKQLVAQRYRRGEVWFGLV